MSIKDAVNSVLIRNAFYRDGYRSLLKLTLILTITIAILIGALVTMIMTQKTEHVFFATTADGRILKLVPLQEEYIEHGDLVAWVSSVAPKIMTFNYIDFRMRLDEAAPNFTANGYDSFLKDLKKSRILESVERNKLIVKATAEAAPEIKASGEINGVFKWVVELPVFVEYIGDKAPMSEHQILRLTIVRVSTLQHTMGVGIEQWIALQPKT